VIHSNALVVPRTKIIIQIKRDQSKSFSSETLERFKFVAEVLKYL
jgi:hypothetical protein